MPANYDNSAWFYDRLSRVVYGKAIVRAQVYLLKEIPAGSTVLIAGGGTGSFCSSASRPEPSRFGMLRSVMTASASKPASFSRASRPSCAVSGW